MFLVISFLVVYRNIYIYIYIYPLTSYLFVPLTSYLFVPLTSYLFVPLTSYLFVPLTSYLFVPLTSYLFVPLVAFGSWIDYTLGWSKTMTDNKGYPIHTMVYEELKRVMCWLSHALSPLLQFTFTILHTNCH